MCSTVAVTAPRFSVIIKDSRKLTNKVQLGLFEVHVKQSYPKYIGKHSYSGNSESSKATVQRIESEINLK